MGRKATSGLFKRGGIWHVDKFVNGKRICESTGESDIRAAEKFLALRMEQIRQAEIYGVRPKRTFREAAIKYVREAQISSIDDDISHIKRLDSFIG